MYYMYYTYSQFTSEIFVLPKTCPKTNTLTFPPLIYTAMFQNLLSKIIKKEILFTFSKAHSLNVFLQSHICRNILYMQEVAGSAAAFI